MITRLKKHWVLASMAVGLTAYCVAASIGPAGDQTAGGDGAQVVAAAANAGSVPGRTDVAGGRACSLTLDDVPDDFIARTPLKTRKQMGAFFAENRARTAMIPLLDNLNPQAEEARGCFKDKGGKAPVRFALSWHLKSAGGAMELSQGKILVAKKGAESDLAIAEECVRPLLAQRFVATSDVQAFEYDGPFPWFITLGRQ